MSTRVVYTQSRINLDAQRAHRTRWVFGLFSMKRPASEGAVDTPPARVPRA